MIRVIIVIFMVIMFIVGLVTGSIGDFIFWIAIIGIPCLILPNFFNK